MKINFDRLKEKLKAVNFMSILFVIFSLISVTFAWFAFSSSVNNNMSIGISAWNIDIKNKNTALTNSLSIKLDNFYPGMDPYTDTITITNNGDISAKLDYIIKKLRIFDDDMSVSNNAKLLDEISHNYPFAINFSADATVIDPGATVNFYISVSWPLDSLDNSNDSLYGNKAYDFKVSENAKKAANSSYVIRNEAELLIDLNVSQHLETDLDASDTAFLPGKSVKYTSSGVSCTSGSTCLNYYVAGANKLSDKTVTVIKDISTVTTSSTYTTSIASRLIGADTILKNVSRDLNTVYHFEGATDRVVGYLGYGSRATDKLNYIASHNGYVLFDASTFSYLSSNTCYFTKTAYGTSTTKVYALKKSGTKMMLYGENMSASCLVVDAMTVNK